MKQLCECKSKVDDSILEPMLNIKTKAETHSTQFKALHDRDAVIWPKQDEQGRFVALGDKVAADIVNAKVSEYLSGLMGYYEGGNRFYNLNYGEFSPTQRKVVASEVRATVEALAAKGITHDDFANIEQNFADMTRSIVYTATKAAAAKAAQLVAMVESRIDLLFDQENFISQLLLFHTDVARRPYAVMWLDHDNMSVKTICHQPGLNTGMWNTVAVTYRCGSPLNGEGAVLRVNEETTYIRGVACDKFYEARMCNGEIVEIKEIPCLGVYVASFSPYRTDSVIGQSISSSVAPYAREISSLRDQANRIVGRLASSFTFIDEQGLSPGERKQLQRMPSANENGEMQPSWDFSRDVALLYDFMKSGAAGAGGVPIKEFVFSAENLQFIASEMTRIRQEIDAATFPTADLDTLGSGVRTSDAFSMVKEMLGRRIRSIIRRIELSVLFPLLRDLIQLVLDNDDTELFSTISAGNIRIYLSDEMTREAGNQQNLEHVLQVITPFAQTQKGAQETIDDILTRIGRANGIAMTPQMIAGRPPIEIGQV